MGLEEYHALVAKVDAFTDQVSSRRAQDLACRKGCSLCCQTWLSVSLPEAHAIREALSALPPARQLELRSRGLAEQERAGRGESPERCAMLDEDGSCAIYEHRPLVCRTQGHALRYPRGLVPVAAIRAKVGQGTVTYCPLNYQDAPPTGPDVLDAERVDQILAVVSHRFAESSGEDPGQRTAISQLAAESHVLACEHPHERSRQRE